MSGADRAARPVSPVHPAAPPAPVHPAAPALPLFIAGLLSIPCIVLQSRLVLLVAQMLFCLLWAIANGKKIKPLYFLLLIASVSFFHLLTPQGEVYFYVWRLPITAGALQLGGRKGVVVSALVFCSLATVRPGIRLPTAAGALLSTTLVYFDMLFQHRRRIRRKTLLNDIDRLLEQLYDTGSSSGDDYGSSDSKNSSSDSKNSGGYPRAVWMREIMLAVLFLGGHVVAIYASNSMMRSAGI